MRRATDVLDRLPETRRPVTWLVLLCLLLWLPGLRAIPALDGGESQVALAARATIEAGGRVPAGLPHGLAWAQAGAVLALEGVGLHAEARARVWAYRLPSLLGGLVAVLAVFGLGRALVGRRAAFLAAAMLAGTAGLAAATQMARAEAPLLGALAVAMGLMGRAYVNPAGVTTRQAAGFWLALAAALLLGGPAGLVAPLLAGITLLAADRTAADGAAWLRALRPGWGVAAMLLPAALATALATGGPAPAPGSGVGGSGVGGWGVGVPGPVLAVLAAFPAGVLALRAIPVLWADRLQSAPRYLLAWAVPAALLAGPVAALPALMLLAAAWAMDPLRRAPPRWLHRLSAVALVGVAAAIGVVAAALPFLADGTISPIALAALPLALGLAVLVLRAGSPARAGLVAVLVAVPLNGVVLEGVLPRIAAPWIAPRLAELVRQVQPGIDGDRFGVAGYQEASVIFALGPGVHLLGSGEAAARFLAEAPGRIVAVADPQEAAFRAEATARGVLVREFGVVAGFNYSRGRRVAIGVYGVDR
jgi:4-amino-4-deoxy-L-arabinose transferase-like glycosyltransferase